MTTVTERRIVREADEHVGGSLRGSPAAAADARFQSLDRAAVYGRRAAPGLVHMRLSPVTSAPSPPQGGPTSVPPYATSVRLSTPFGDPNITAVIEPHYSTLPHPGTSSNRSSPVPAASVIRVSGGQQQTIRVPYPAGAPASVQVHLLARTGVGGTPGGGPPRSDSPQRGLGSPSAPAPYLSPPGAPASASATPAYGVARATQTSATPMFPAGGGSSARFYSPVAPSGVGSPASGYKVAGGFPEPGKPAVSSAGPLQGSRRAASPLPYQNISSSSSSTASSSPTRSLKYGAAGGAERGVPEGAASNSPNFPQDAMYHSAVPGGPQQQPLSPATQQSPGATPNATPTGTPTAASSVYYAMNV